MVLELSRSAGHEHPPDRQAESLREIARQQANANTWNIEQRASIESQLNPLSFAEAARQWYASEMEKIPQQLRTPATILFIVIAPIAVMMVIPALVLAVVAFNGIFAVPIESQHRGERVNQLPAFNSRRPDHRTGIRSRVRYF